MDRDTRVQVNRGERDNGSDVCIYMYMYIILSSFI